jgi:hypothetical protein
LVHIAAFDALTIPRATAKNKVHGAVARDDVSNAVEQSRVATLSGEAMFRLRMENQCQQIVRYRLQVLRESGRLLSSDEAAMEWIERFAASYGNPLPN